MQLEAISWDRLTEALAERVVGTKAADGGPWLRVAVDGAPAAEPGVLAARLGDALRVHGRDALVLDAGGFLRPASLRYEFGREDPDAYYDTWLDTGALWREVFGPLEAGGDGRVLPDLWDPVTDRATRSPYTTLPPGGVVLLHGPLLLGRWFPFDLVVHLRLSAAALARRTREEDRWTLPAFARYEEEADPAAAADVLVRLDDPRRPAWRPERGVGDDR
ncbi:uridine kinase [Streptomyces sp. B8F3]|uniref:uridine kinase n=1 Tax=unclassified Streptomyces TaxID=2593676 RepID=UPI00325C53EF